MVLDLMARNCSFPSSKFGSLQTMQSQHSKWVYIIHIILLLAILIVHCVIGRPEKVEMARPFKPNQRAARYNRRLHSSTETQMSASWTVKQKYFKMIQPYLIHLQIVSFVYNSSYNFKRGNNLIYFSICRFK